MTDTTVSGVRRARSGTSGYRFGQVIRMEWIKLRSLRANKWTLVFTAIGAIGLSVTVGINTRNPDGDLTNNALAGIAPALLSVGVLGVLVMTGEYTSGTVRATFAAVPRRTLVVAAKALVFGGVALAFGEAVSFIAFFAGAAALRHGIAAPALDQPRVLQAVVLSGTSCCLIGLLGLGLGAIIQNTAFAVAVLVGGVYVAAQFIGFVARGVAGYMPVLIVANSLSVTKPQHCQATGPCPSFLSPWAGLIVLCGYAAVSVAVGCLVVARRDVG
jgi:ABC-2 type transport system permease protein